MRRQRNGIKRGVLHVWRRATDDDSQTEGTKMKKRMVLTFSGDEVEVNTTTKVEGGWKGYVIGRHGYAVPIFIPEK
jgi:hypothetical protein